MLIRTQWFNRMSYLNLIKKLINFLLCFVVDVSDRNDPQAMALQREREERVRRLREQQEDERKKKLEELRQHVSCSRPLDQYDNMF